MVDKEIIGQVPNSIKNFRIANKIFNIILCIIIIPIVCVNITMFIQSTINKDKVPSFLGYKFFVILTGSMEDTLNIEDFIITKEVKDTQLNIGDIISFKEKNTIITHRITQINNEGNIKIFTTKGDNNNTEDLYKVTQDKIEGKYIFKIPYMGKVLKFLQSIWGILLLILIPVTTIITSFRREQRINMKKAIRKSKRLEYNRRKAQ